jgi:hypothetical protein
MPLYKYEYLEVTCLERKKFRVDQMRDAVAYLKEQPQSEYVGLSAITHYHSREFGFRLKASPMINLKNITGRTPKQLWEMFDADVTRQVKYFEHRMSRDAGRP